MSVDVCTTLSGVAGLAAALRDAGVMPGRPGCRLHAEPDRDGDRHAGSDQHWGRLVLMRHGHRTSAALDRLGQVEPKVLFTVDGYFYKGKAFKTLGMRRRWPRESRPLRSVIVVSTQVKAGYPGPSPMPSTTKTSWRRECSS